jgi:hypothetical protein
MTTWKKMCASTAVAALLVPAAGWAEVTADQVWNKWSDSLQTFGYTVSVGSQQRAGDTLVITDLVLTMARPEADVAITLSEMRLRESGGSVAITLANDIPIIGTSKIADAPTTTIAMNLRQSGLEMVVSGTEAEMTYATTAPEMSLEMEALEADGAAAPVKMQLALKDTAGSYTWLTDGGQHISSDVTTGTLSFSLSGAEPDSDSTFTMNGAMRDLNILSEGFMPDGVDMTDMAAAIGAGFYADVEVSYGAGNYAMEFADVSGTGALSSSGDGGTFYLSMSGDGLEYGLDGGRSAASLAVQDLPFPIDFALDSTSFLFSMPISQSDDPQLFAARIGMAGLTVSEQLWQMFDPAAMLPRTPVDLLVDLSGSVKLLVNLFDPVAVQSVPLPGELESLDINAVHFAAAGADLSGGGGFSFDNTMGFPMPKGAVDLRLVGAYALMDKLSAMGLLPSDQVAGFRAMLGLFSVPAGDDVLTSKIEVREDGGVYANGQRLQ